MKKVIVLIILLFISLEGYALSEYERVLKETVLYENQGSYLQNSLYRGAYVLRWNKAYFPIKVYISHEFKLPNYYYDAFAQAVDIWQEELKGLITFELTDNKKDANIIFMASKRDKMPKGNIVNDKEITLLAYTESVIKRKKLQKMIINVYEKDEKGKFYKPNLVLNTSVHEFAHALGILGHSNDEKSVMHSSGDNQIENKVIYINNEDRNTIKLLYTLEPDITNGDKRKETGNVNSELILGTIDERLDFSIQNEISEAMQYQDFQSMLQVSLLYRQKKDYKNMWVFLEKAKEYAYTTEDFKNLYMTYAAYYSDLHNPILSIWYIFKAFFIK